MALRFCDLMMACYRILEQNYLNTVGTVRVMISLGEISLEINDLLF